LCELAPRGDAVRSAARDPRSVKRKLRWVLRSSEGDEVFSGLSFGSFVEDEAIARAMRTSPPPPGHALLVYLDNREVARIEGSR